MALIKCFAAWYSWVFVVDRVQPGNERACVESVLFRMRALLIVGLLLVVPTSGFAEQQDNFSDEVVEAAAHGRELFDAGRYEEAIDFLMDAYQAHQEPMFFQYIGRCYEELEDPCNAEDYYQRFLDETEPPDEIRRELVERLLELEQNCDELEAEEPLPVDDEPEDVGPPRRFGQFEEEEPEAHRGTDIAGYVLFGVGGAAVIPATVLWILALVEHTQVKEDPWWSYALSGDIIGISGFALIAVGAIVLGVGRRRDREDRALSLRPGPANGLSLSFSWH